MAAVDIEYWDLMVREWNGIVGITRVRVCSDNDSIQNCLLSEMCLRGQSLFFCFL